MKRISTSDAHGAIGRRYRRGSRDDAGMAGTQSGAAESSSNRFANGDPGYQGEGMGTADNDALAAFLKSKGLSDEDIAKALSLGLGTTDDMGGDVPEGDNTRQGGSFGGSIGGQGGSEGGTTDRRRSSATDHYQVLSPGARLIRQATDAGNRKIASMNAAAKNLWGRR